MYCFPHYFSIQVPIEKWKTVLKNKIDNYGGNTLLGHVVGAGKSYTMIAMAMEGKRLGLHNKAMLVVPNHLTEQMGDDVYKLYPNTKTLVATKNDFTPQNRKEFCSKIATGDYDIAIIGHSQFQKIPLSYETQKKYIDEQILDIENSLGDMKNEKGNNRYSIKQLEITLDGLEKKLEKLTNSQKKDDVVTFEELGIDKLFVDESHLFKNLFSFTKTNNISGVAQAESQKSTDMFTKTRYMDEITGGKGTIFATGTPVVSVAQRLKPCIYYYFACSNISCNSLNSSLNLNSISILLSV